MSSSDSLPGPDSLPRPGSLARPGSLEFITEEQFKKAYLTKDAIVIYENNKRAIIDLLKKSINDSMKNELIQKLASLSDEEKKMFFRSEKIEDLNERIKLYPKIGRGETLGGGNIGDVYKRSINKEWEDIDTTTSDYIFIAAGLLLLVGAVGITNILLGGSKHKKKKGRKSKKTKKSMKHKKGRKSKKAKKSMKKKKGRKSMKKRKSNKKRK